MRQSGSAGLAGCRVLVAEDEYDVAQEVAAALRDAGAEVVGPVPDVAEALALLVAGRVDAALLDVNLRGGAVWPLVDVLLARGMPLVLATGYDRDAIPTAYSGLPRCEKPATGHDLVRHLAVVLSAWVSETDE